MTTIDNPLLSEPKNEDLRGQAVNAHSLSCMDSIAAYVQAANASNTRLAYQGDLKDFLSWGGCLPASEEVLASYICDRAVTHSPHTIARRIVGISRAHTAQGLADPSKSDLVRTVLRGIRRLHGKPQRQAAPLLKRDLIELLPFMRGTRGARDRAMVLLGFAAALRRSELVALNAEDLAFCSDGMLLHLPRSKTDQTGEGRKIAVPYGRTVVCPVHAIRAWLELTGVEAGAVFRSVSKSGLIGGRLSGQSVSLILKQYASQAGISSHLISGHSLRAGFVTSAAQAGVAVNKIQEQTGHRSLAMLARYVRDGRLFTENACGSVL